MNRPVRFQMSCARRWALGFVVVFGSCTGSQALAQTGEPEAPVPTPTAEVVVTVAPTPVATVAPTPVAAVAPTPVATSAPTPVVTVAPTPVVTVAPTPTAAPARRPVTRAIATPTPTPAPVAAAETESEPSCVFPTTAAPCEITIDQCSILGTEGSDLLPGGATADLICGLGGDDAIDGGGGDDTIVGGGGDDVITGDGGADCMLGGKGHNRYPGADSDDLVLSGEPPPGSTPPFTIDRHARCHLPGSAGGVDGGSPPVDAGGGAVEGTVHGGALIVDIVKLVRESEQPPTETFPIELSPDAREIEGVARLVVHCDSAARGRLVARIRGVKRPNLAGRAVFTCEPPSSVAELRLTKRARHRLADRDELEIGIGITVEGVTSGGRARVTVHAGPA